MEVHCRLNYVSVHEKHSAYRGGGVLLYTILPESCYTTGPFVPNSQIARSSVCVRCPAQLTHVLHKAAIAMLSDLRTFRQRTRARPLLICVRQA
jgi:hypothetical protein